MLTDDTPDLSELLSSLELEEGDQGDFLMKAGPEPLSEPGPEPPSDFDEELLREVSPAGETGGVISTDAFLEDIAGGDLGYSGGLTDELSALTGLGRPSRPKASVNKLPEPAATGDVLRRDARVDRETMLKIIEGIKNL
jgi:hypothetical protein